MNEFEPGIFNSDLVFNYLLRKGSSFTLYLVDGAELSGTLMGWDADFLLVRDGKFIQMVQIKKILRLQAEFDEIPAKYYPVAQSTDLSSMEEPNRTNSIAGSFKPKLKSALVETKTPATENNKFEEKVDFKNRLNDLVRNW